MPAPPEPLNTLQRARSLLASPESWAQGWYAFLPSGDRTTSRNPEACRWCLRGAIAKLCPNDSDYGAQAMAVAELAETIAGEPVDDSVEPMRLTVLRSQYVFTFNDDSSRTHADVLAVLDETIERLSHAPESL